MCILIPMEGIWRIVKKSAGTREGKGWAVVRPIAGILLTCSFMNFIPYKNSSILGIFLRF